MKSSDAVIKRLNEALFLELAAINQYWIHHRLLDDWGITLLAKKEKEESIEEMQHADKLVERIIFLGGHPNMQTLGSLRIGESVKEILESDLAAEMEAHESYTKSRDICQQERDYVSMGLFEQLLTDEEEHIDFLETQLQLFDSIGAENYQQLQAGPAN